MPSETQLSWRRPMRNVSESINLRMGRALGSYVPKFTCACLLPDRQRLIPCELSDIPLRVANSIFRREGRHPSRRKILFATRKAIKKDPPCYQHSGSTAPQEGIEPPTKRNDNASRSTPATNHAKDPPCYQHSGSTAPQEGIEPPTKRLEGSCSIL